MQNAPKVAMAAPAAPETWGPHVWRLLHLLADVSDRRDIYPLWNTFMRTTALAIPCQKCQIHMKEYLVHHTFMPKNWQTLSSDDTRTHIRVWIHEFHNAINGRLGKPCPPLPPVHDSRPRPEILSDIAATYETVKECWGRVTFLSGPAFMEWKRAAALLIQLVRGGSY